MKKNILIYLLVTAVFTSVLTFTPTKHADATAANTGNYFEICGGTTSGSYSRTQRTMTVRIKISNPYCVIGAGIEYSLEGGPLVLRNQSVNVTTPNGAIRGMENVGVVPRIHNFYNGSILSVKATVMICIVPYGVCQGRYYYFYQKI